MPILSTKIPTYKKSNEISVEWNSFKGGLNTMLRPTELKDTELAQADNIILTGSGVPTGRWGTTPYFTAGATGTVRGFGSYVTGASISEILALSDEGYLVKKNGSSYTRINGSSWPSGSIIRSEQLGGYSYFVNKNVAFSQYKGSTLEMFATVSKPTVVGASNISGASGSYTWSWKIAALSYSGGTTEQSEPITLGSLPQDLTRTSVNVKWNAVSALSLRGYEIYRGLQGDETYLANVGPSITDYVDTGEEASESILAPISNTTGGIKSEFIKKVNDRLIMVDANDPTKLLISGRFPDQSKFSWTWGGGYIYIDPDSGQSITGIEVNPSSDKIIVFKEYASYAVTLSTLTIGNYTVLDATYTPVSTLIGCSNPDTIQIVENDIFYFGKKGVYVMGYEPNYLNLIRTNETSARIRPYLAGLSAIDYKTACSMYVDNKYILSFPARKECLVYDRERGAWLGIWKLPFGIAHMKKFVDVTGTEKWVIGSYENNQVYTFESSINSDNGAIITKTIRTKKEYYDSWSAIKTISMFYILFRNITGSVTVNVLLEDRNGSTSTIKTFTITGSEIAGASGWGSNMWGNTMYGNTIGSVVISSDELTRWATLYKDGRIIQFEVVCNSPNSNFELLGIKTTASVSSGILPSSQRV